MIKVLFICHGNICRSPMAEYIFRRIVAMERYNVRNLARYCPPGGMEKVRLLRDFTDSPGDIDDPWYSGDFEGVGKQIEEGCEGLLRTLRQALRVP